MATTITAMPSTTGRNSKYPWDKFFDGQIWALTEGEDFKVNAKSFRGAAYTAARNKGLALETAMTVDESGKTVIALRAKGEAKVKVKTEVKKPAVAPAPKAPRRSVKK